MILNSIYNQLRYLFRLIPYLKKEAVIAALCSLRKRLTELIKKIPVPKKETIICKFTELDQLRKNGLGIASC